MGEEVISMSEWQTLEDRIIFAKNDLNEKDHLIREYMPFIIKVTYERTGRPVEAGVDDEVSIAMSGFEEAIDRFDIEKGKFLTFARSVITFRLTDYFRKEHRGPEVIHVDFTRRESEVERADANQAVENYRKLESIESRQEEISRFKEQLLDWDLSLEDMVKHSPGQKRTRQRYLSIAETIVKFDDIYESFIKNRRLPVKKIQEKILLPRKKIETGRIYIIGLVIILKGDYSMIKQYIPRR
jgi:RNA polymerase sigma factor